MPRDAPLTLDAKECDLRFRRARAEKWELEVQRARGDWVAKADHDKAMADFSLEWCRGLEWLGRSLPMKLWEAESMPEMAAILADAHRNLRLRISRERSPAIPGLRRGRGGSKKKVIP